MPTALPHGSSSTLTDLEVDILAFESSWRGRPQAREQEVRERFGMSPARYQQVLNRLLDQDEALEHDPLLVRRLRRVREQRRDARSAHRLS